MFRFLIVRFFLSSYVILKWLNFYSVFLKEDVFLLQVCFETMNGNFATSLEMFRQIRNWLSFDVNGNASIAHKKLFKKVELGLPHF